MGTATLWPPDTSNIQLYKYSIRNDINKINFDQLYTLIIFLIFLYISLIIRPLDEYNACMASVLYVALEGKQKQGSAVLLSLSLVTDTDEHYERMW
jgi:hypothetical protein